MANKLKRVEMLIKKNTSEILQFEVKNSGIGFVTVTNCSLSLDYQYAKIYVSFLGTKNPKANLEALNAAKGYIKTALAKRLDIWKLPQIEFILDDSYEQQQKIENILKKDQEAIEKMKTDK